MPRMACIVSSYNRPRLIVDCIESIKEQTFKDFVAVIADDNSKAETVEAINKTIAKDPRFIFLGCAAGRPTAEQRATDLRYCRTINAGIVAAGDFEFISYIPDDDYYMPCCFEHRVKAFDENPEEDVVYTKQRSLSFDKDSNWDSMGHIPPGRVFLNPNPAIDIDPATGKKVDIASWWPGYRSPIRGIDHGMLSHRRSCLDELGSPWWPEVPASTGPGDALFFERLDRMGYKAFAIDCIGHTKRFHKMNFDKAAYSEIRE